MILVDTSVWIDHFHHAEARLVALAEAAEIGCHPDVIEELALGLIQDRARVLADLEALWQFPVLTHQEILALVANKRLWGQGLSSVDAALVGSVLLRPESRLWTRDKRVLAACRDIGVPVLEE